MKYNTFTGMPLIPYRIIRALIDNENFWKLLYYPTYDALSKENLTTKQKMSLIWQGQEHMEDYYIFLTNIQPDMELKARTLLKCYRYVTQPVNPVISTVVYRFDFLFGSTIPLVEYEGITCNRGDLLEMEMMKSLNGKDVAGVGYLQYNRQLSRYCSSEVGIGNNYTYTGLSVVMATEFTDSGDAITCE